MGKGEEYAGPESNPTYEDTETMQTFDDLDDDDTFDDVPIHRQAMTSSENDEGDEEEEEVEEVKLDKEARKARSKKEESKKSKGQKGDDLEALDLESEEDEEDEDAPKPKKGKEEEEDEEEDEEEEVVAPKDTTEEKKAKVKPTYVTVGGETYSLDSDALISTPVDGKVEKVTLQELKNHYNAKVVGDKRFNEVNLKEQSVKKLESEVSAKIAKFDGVKSKVEEILKNPESNPKEAFKIFLDSIGVDSYDLMERSFKADLTELANVLNMEPAERKAYFLEKKNSHLLEQSKKRDEQLLETNRVTSYRQKADALRKSFGVSEAQYVDALEELKSYGTEEKDISERDIVEWAATKPHRGTVKDLLNPYKDQLQGDAYGELSWKLANILRVGSETPDTIKKHLAEVYGLPTEVKQLSKKLNPLGRKSQTPAKVSPKNKQSFESFDDIDDD